MVWLTLLFEYRGYQDMLYYQSVSPLCAGMVLLRTLPSYSPGPPPRCQVSEPSQSTNCWLFDTGTGGEPGFLMLSIFRWRPLSQSKLIFLLTTNFWANGVRSKCQVHNCHAPFLLLCGVPWFWLAKIWGIVRHMVPTWSTCAPSIMLQSKAF